MESPTRNGAAGVVLVGGRSSRMGTAKAALEWHGSTLLGRTLGVLARALDGRLLVVRSPDQPLPSIPPRAEVVDDPAPGLGPLQGIAAGLAELVGRAPAAFICSTDLPFLHPLFVTRVMSALTDGFDAVLPVARGYPQPLAAAYRITLAPLAAELVAAGDLRPPSLLRRCATLVLDDAALLRDPALADADPGLDSVVNVNFPQEYHAARDRAAPRVTVVCPECGAARTVRAATASEARQAAAAAGLAVGGQLAAALNGVPISGHGDIPLVGGDTIAFACADAGG
ncbi:MAG TPA: molybdenum cofactor guanylyltransferase [Pseudonocardiaceae bacterium]|nr:molybdenum cofactor guanylyltransferase [Pseudonocardiaceae bacterium]